MCVCVICVFHHIQFPSIRLTGWVVICWFFWWSQLIFRPEQPLSRYLPSEFSSKELFVPLCDPSGRLSFTSPQTEKIVATFTAKWDGEEKAESDSVKRLLSLHCRRLNTTALHSLLLLLHHGKKTHCALLKFVFFCSSRGTNQTSDWDVYLFIVSGGTETFKGCWSVFNWLWGDWLQTAVMWLPANTLGSDVFIVLKSCSWWWEDHKTVSGSSEKLVCVVSHRQSAAPHAAVNSPDESKHAEWFNL